MKVTIVGLGLIGGCMGIDLRKAGWAEPLVGVDLNEEHGRMAVKLGLVDRIEEEGKALAEADIVILATQSTHCCPRYWTSSKRTR